MTDRISIQNELEKAFPDEFGEGGSSRERWLAPCVDVANFLGGAGSEGRRLAALGELNLKMREEYESQDHANRMRQKFRDLCEKWRVDKDRWNLTGDHNNPLKPPPMPDGTIGALNLALAKIERHVGFGAADILLGPQDPEAFLRIIQQKRLQRDPLFLTPGHREDTHRMQWAMLSIAKVLQPYAGPEVSLPNLYGLAGSVRGTQGALWDFVFDRAPERAQGPSDCRNPETMTAFIVTRFDNFPLLSWYVHAKFVTHVQPNPDRIMAYVKQLLYPDREPTDAEKAVIDRYIEMKRIPGEELLRIRS